VAKEVGGRAHLGDEARAPGVGADSLLRVLDRQRRHQTQAHASPLKILTTLLSSFVLLARVIKAYGLADTPTVRCQESQATKHCILRTIIT
jgi:hypothetical protein